MFRRKILRIFSFLYLVRSSSQTSNPATIRFDECSNLTENNSYSQVSGEQNYTEQSSKATKRTFSDLEGIDVYKNKLFASTLIELKTVIDSETGQDDDDFLNIFEIKDRSTYLDSLTIGIPEYQLDELFSITIPVTNSSDNFIHPSSSYVSNIPSIENNDSVDFSILRSSIDLQPVSASENTFITNSKDLNILNQQDLIISDRFKRIERLEIYYNLREFIAKLIYFRKDFYDFINKCMEKDNQELISESELGFILQDNPEYEYLFTSHSSNRKSASRNLMLLIYLSLDFAKRIEMNFEALKIYHSLTDKITRRNKSICKLKTRFDDERLNKKTRSELSREIKSIEKDILNLKSERESLPERPCVKIIYKYMRCLSKHQKQFKNFGPRLIALFLPLIKITKFYDEKLKIIVGNHLNKLRCPGAYKNRDILILQNSSRIDASNQSFYIDENGLTFIILDWVFYFFSVDFQEQLASGTIDSPKILSRLTALIFILSNRFPETFLPFSEKEFFDKWMISLELKFEMEVFCQSSASNFFTELHDKIKHFDGNINMSEDNFYQKIFRFLKLYFLNDLEIIIQRYLTKLYDKGLSEYNYYLSKETNE